MQKEVLPKHFTPELKWSKRQPNVQVVYIALLLSHKGSAGKNLTFNKYCKVIQVVMSNDDVVRKVIVEYLIPSLKMKQVCVDVRRLVILPTLETADRQSDMH